ncbi:MAG: hypothetical protein ACOCQB_00560 [Halanaerobiaceae bacterium]
MVIKIVVRQDSKAEFFFSRQFFKQILFPFISAEDTDLDQGLSLLSA